MDKNKNESILDYAIRLFDEDNEFSLNAVELYECLFHEKVSADIAQRRIRGIRDFIRLIQNDEDIGMKHKIDLTINADGSQTRNALLQLSEEDIKTPIKLLMAHGYDPKIFMLVNSKSSMWHQKSNTYGLSTLYCSKITVKLQDKITDEFLKDVLIENCKKYKKSLTNNHIQPLVKNYIKNNNDKMLEINISDLHLGKMGCEEEIGKEFNHDMACKRFKYIILDILEQVKHLEFEKIYFIWSNDFYHIDTPEGTTTAGTRQDVTLRWQKLFKTGIDLLVWSIDALSIKAPVETFYVGANHDRTMSYYATQYLYAWYHDSNKVNVDDNGISRKYIEYGNTMVGYGHGSDEGKNISNIMPKEKPEMYGRTKFRYFHAAHYHSSQSRPYSENCGYEVRYLSSPTGDDSYHYKKGYLATTKCGYGFVYDKKLGQQLEIRSNIIID